MAEPRTRPEMLMPVSDEGAALQFFVEAMKANTAVLQGLQAEQKETLKLVHDTRERVIRIESNATNEQIKELKREVDELKGAELRRAGATNLATGMVRNGPALITLLGFIVLVVVVLVANGKLP